MSVAEKEAIMSANNKKIAENEQRVYDAGYAAGQAEGGIDFSIPAVLYRLENLNTLGAKEVVFNFENIKSLASFFHITNTTGYVENTTVEHITINCGRQIASCNTMLYINGAIGDNTLKRLTLNADTSKASFFNMIAFLYALEVIDGAPLDLSSAGNAARMFYKAEKMREIRFVAGSIKGNIHLGDTALWSDESIQSIVDGLADLTGSDTKTLTLHADIVLTDEQKATITAKNWTLVQ